MLLALDVSALGLRNDDVEVLEGFGMMTLKFWKLWNDDVINGRFRNDDVINAL